MVLPLMTQNLRKKLDIERLLSRVTGQGYSRRRKVEAPLRSELFNAEQLSTHAKAIAGQHQAGVRGASNPLLGRLGESERMLQAFNRATLLADQTRRVTPAAEWLLDNS